MIDSSNTLKATEFKARCLKIMDDVKEKKQEFIITKYGRAIAKLVPVINDEEKIYGCMQGTGEIKGDIFSTNEQWDAER